METPQLTLEPAEVQEILKGLDHTTKAEGLGALDRIYPLAAKLSNYQFLLEKGRLKQSLDEEEGSKGKVIEGPPSAKTDKKAEK